MENTKKAIEWNKESTLKTIELWEKNRCLYDPRNGMYHNKHARYDALIKMVDALKSMQPNLTIEDVKMKINNLRSQYHHEIAKLQKSGKNGAGTNDIYQPTAYWFPTMQFLKKYVKSKKGKRNFEVAMPHSSQVDLDDPDAMSYSQDSTSCAEEPPNKKRKSSLSDAIRSLTSSMVNQPSTWQSYPNDVEAFGEHVKAELNKLFSEQLRDEAMFEFSSIMYSIKQKQRNLNKYPLN